MIWSVQAFTNQSVTTNQTVTSVPYWAHDGRICGFEYILSTATTGTYVSVTARILVAADSLATTVTPVDTANAVLNNLALNINSNNRYVAFRFDDLPVAPYVQVQLVSVTNQTITFNSVRLVYTDN